VVKEAGQANGTSGYGLQASNWNEWSVKTSMQLERVVQEAGQANGTNG